MVLSAHQLESFKKFLNVAAFILVIEFAFPHTAARATGQIETADITVKTMVARDVVIKADPRFEQAVAKEETSAPVKVENDMATKLPIVAELPVVQQYQVTATAYASVPEQTDGDPFTMADGTRVYDGAIAANFLKFGTRVRFPDLYGDKIFKVHDRMNARYNGKHIVDVWHADNGAAKKFGSKRNVMMEVLED